MSRKELVQVAPGVWRIEGRPLPYFAPPIPARFPYAQRSVVIRLADQSLLVHSPLSPSAELLDAIAELGQVRHLVSPNKIHHLFMGDWAKAIPDVRLYASPGLTAKRPDLRFSATLGDRPEPSWADEIDQLQFRGSVFMDEIVFFHRASRTLVLGDLIENHEPDLFTPMQRFWARRNRMLAPWGETPLNFRCTFWNRRVARECLERMLAWRPERVLLMHGRPVETATEEFLRRAFAWLAA